MTSSFCSSTVRRRRAAASFCSFDQRPWRSTKLNASLPQSLIRNVANDIDFYCVFIARSQRVPPSAGPMINSATKQSIPSFGGSMDCFAFARNDKGTPSLGRRKMANLVGDLCRNRCGPWRAATPLHIDLHPEGFPSPRGADAVHGGGTLDAPRMRGIEEHERLCAGSNLLDLLPQQAAILNDRLVGLAEMLAGAVLDRTHRFDRPLVVHVDVGAHASVGRGRLLMRIETVIVRFVLPRTIIGKFVQFEALVAHLVLVDRRGIRGEDRIPIAVLVIHRHV